MTLASGAKLGPYEILAPLGAGGMGEVYRARDTKLGREVAIKVLPEEFTQHQQKLVRFEREAKLLAALNHPGIATLHGLEEAEGKPFLVMELVEGETLADRIARGPVPVEETLEISRQIAEALEAAHEKGVIHRDLKPANIMVDPEGHVKVLDFGLAKAFADELPESELSQSPTLSRDATRAGVILGTAAYMSPEQAKGKAVDKRSDIFSFGIVLYEMLAGKKAFGGEDVSEVLASIIKSEPNWEVLPTDLDPRLQKLLRRCLRKERKNRLRDVGDVRLEIQEIVAEPVSATKGPTTSGFREKVAWGLVVLLGIVAAASLMRIAPESQPTAVRRVSLSLMTGDYAPLARSGFGRGGFALDRAGSVLVIQGVGLDGVPQLFLRRLDEPAFSPIAGTQNAEGAPAVSPDGGWVAFFADQQLKKVALSGGGSIPMYSVPVPPPGITWLDNDAIVFSTPAGLVRLSTEGGTPEQVTTVDAEAGEIDHRWPFVAADGKTLAYAVWSGSLDNSRVRLRSLETGEETTLMLGNSPRLTPTGHLLFQRGTSIWAAPVDVDTLQARAEAVPVLDRVSIGPQNGRSLYDLTEDGTLFYPRRPDYAPPLVETDLTGRPLRDIGEGFRGVDHGPPRFSPDGNFVAIVRHPIQSPDRIAIHDLRRGTLTVLGGAVSRYPVWTPEGERITFGSDREGTWDIFEVNPFSGAEPQPLLVRPGDQIPWSWHPNGDLLAFVDGSAGKDIWLLPRDGEPFVLFESAANEDSPVFSPDGRLLAYTSDATGRLEVWAQEYPTSNRAVTVSTGGGSAPVWTPRSDGLYYQNLEGDIFYVSIMVEPELGGGTPVLAMENIAAGPADAGFDIAPSGQSFVMMRDVPLRRETLDVVVNWFEELKRLVPTN